MLLPTALTPILGGCREIIRSASFLAGYTQWLLSTLKTTWLLFVDRTILNTQPISFQNFVDCFILWVGLQALVVALVFAMGTLSLERVLDLGLYSYDIA